MLPPVGAMPSYSVAAGPDVASTSPASGPAEGGNWVVLKGGGFVKVTSVEFGAVRAARFVVATPAVVVALAPAHSPGSVEVVVVAGGATSLPGAHDRYVYVATGSHR